MDPADVARRLRRPPRVCRAFSPKPPEAMEARTILSLATLQDINPAALFPAEDTGAGGPVYFVTGAADGGSGLNVKTASGAAILKGFPATTDSASDFTSDALRCTRQYPRLFESAGTIAGTTLVQDIGPGPGSSDPMPLTELNGMLIVAADDGTHGLELLSGPVPPAPLAARSR